MKIQFRTLNYQLDAVQAVVNCFQGQTRHEGKRYMRDLGNTKSKHPQQIEINIPQHIDYDEFGFANQPIDSLDNVLKNIKKIQKENNLSPSTHLIVADNQNNKNLTSSPLNIDVEMETGTGKTYCYIRTMFELNRQYGWSKFIIVVPSIAIREGVDKSFSMMSEHFQQEYGKKARFFIYDSKALHHLENFSADGGLNVMIINVQAFNATGKDARRIHEELDEFQSRRPIDVIAKNRPILILDEPQKMHADKTLASLANFKPLFILRYSATHKRQYNLVYRFDALDAYNQKLVKKITVKGIEVQNLSGSNSYLYLQHIEISKSAPIAKLELEIGHNNRFKLEIRKIKKGDDLFEISNEARQYNGYVVAEIDARENSVSFTNGVKIYVGEALGDVNETTLRTIQIRETIRAHISKEKALFDRGIKVLSLFFIDEVAKYRQYDDENNAQDGEYVRIFKTQYEQVLNELKDTSIIDSPYWSYLQNIDIDKTHNGYFSIDKKSKRLIDPTIDRRANEVESTSDSDAYDLILKDKERLLSFDEPTRFIFSHSALREGWDNPNVFTICTLKHSDNVISRRQEVGRGLRLAVNKNGDRMDAKHFGENSPEIHQLNNLTVVTNESYKEFVKNLQKEILDELSSRPTKADQQYFSGKFVRLENGEKHQISEQQAKQIYHYLVKNDYIDDNDSLTEVYKTAQKANQLAQLPPELGSLSSPIFQLIEGILEPDLIEGMIDNIHLKKENPINSSNLNRKEFQALWKRINRKAVFEIQLDSGSLIQESITKIEKEAQSRGGLFVESITYKIGETTQKDNIEYSDLQIRESFGEYRTQTEKTAISVSSQVKYDLVGELANKTNLLRKTIVAILKGIKNDIFEQFKCNPEAFIREVSRIINEQQAKMVIQNLTYHPLSEGYHDNEIFVSNIVPSDAYQAKHHIWEYVATDSKVETEFAKELDNASEVIVYAKLPHRFQIPTPFGHYNPDWAIVLEKSDQKEIYFVAETKGSSDENELRLGEQNRIQSAKRFFQTLNEEQHQNVRYDVVSCFDELMKKVLN
ncbi:type III restriction-modification system endonuclease [Pasteurella multocida]|uniref:type III restriction-modification system endonuclease n=1 Tax=Pasteurella multocida TaxID=747 RepID=UPI0007F8A29F|nr:type III restriction-modification system endonuclease [Pasteurella multocida]OBP23219.1 restriction endonuclease subunit R [Pasteurella multocida subsp. multocida]UWZ95759.1 DEAD/DEAH box helicase family protein [Pasteurella multocida subsp. multocida]